MMLESIESRVNRPILSAKLDFLGSMGTLKYTSLLAKAYDLCTWSSQAYELLHRGSAI